MYATSIVVDNDPVVKLLKRRRRSFVALHPLGWSYFVLQIDSIERCDNVTIHSITGEGMKSAFLVYVLIGLVYGLIRHRWRLIMMESKRSAVINWERVIAQGAMYGLFWPVRAIWDLAEWRIDKKT
jgi:hypothetical protein